MLTTFDNIEQDEFFEVIRIKDIIIFFFLIRNSQWIAHKLPKRQEIKRMENSINYFQIYLFFKKKKKVGFEMKKLKV